jgi:hypothetical protein
MSAFFCVGLSCVTTGVAMGLSPIQGDLPKYPNGFIVSEVNSNSAQARRPNA